MIAAAERDFGVSGYHGARLADIAEAAGIRRSSLLYHFSSKEALHEEVVRRLFVDLEARFVARGSKGGTSEDLVIGLVGVFLEFIDERKAFAPIVLRGLIDDEGPTRGLLSRVLAPLLDAIEHFVQPIAPPGIPVRAALVQIGSDALLRASSGPLRHQLWGEEASLALARRLLLDG